MVTNEYLEGTVSWKELRTWRFYTRNSDIHERATRYTNIFTSHACIFWLTYTGPADVYLIPSLFDRLMFLQSFTNVLQTFTIP